ncbi:MAG TPA: VWA domain-containing protein [Candidatus Eisenbacteria bacterium]|nr:VWA domain-containing protein [Candidatus Eisenbacteria bacterium]
MTSRGRSSADATAARLAAVSRLVADQLEVTLPAMRAALGTDADRWLELGADLAAHCGGASGAVLAYLRLDPARLRRVGLAPFAAWLRAIERIGAGAPALAASFAETTATLAGDVDAGWLDACADALLGLRADGGWRGERVAQAMVGAIPIAADVLGPGDVAAWCGLAALLRSGLDEGLFFRVLAPEVASWSPDDRRAWLDAARTLARRHVPTAVVYYRDLPRTIEALPPEARSALLAALGAAAADVRPSDLQALLPIVGALTLDVSRAARAVALAAALRVAREFPVGVVAYLRAMPMLFEERVPPRLEAWVDHGLAIGAENADAGCAYFALESRTSVAVLSASPVAVTLDEAQGVLRKVVQMLSGAPATPRATGRFQLRSPFEPPPVQATIALPATIDVLASYEDNRRLFGVLATLLVGRRLHGTYADETVLAALTVEDAPPLLSELFAVTDGYRVAHRLALEYPGIAGELAWACRRLLAVWTADADPPSAVVFDALLALALDPHAAERRVAPWLAAAAIGVLPALRPLASPAATAADALAIAERLVPAFAHLVGPPAVDPTALEFLPILLDAGEGEGPFATGLDVDDEGAVPVPGSPERPPEELLRELQVLLDQRRAGDGAGTQLSLEELQRLLESGLLGELAQGSGTDLDASGLFVTQLMGKLLGERRELARAGAQGVGPRRAGRVPHPADDSLIYFYDEWDHVIADYRPAWCQLREVPVADDAGVFYDRALARHADLIPELRRCFQQVRPDRYRAVRGLEDGEDIDWHAAVEARVERRVRGTASTKLYTARTRQEREVATLFLLDMSASTDEAAEGAEGERIIDIAKDALVIMAAALEEIGDTFAIYGFSGQGRERVEVYPVKTFGERLTPAVRGRLGGIEPKGSTRMGTALRHATTLMRDLTAPAQHLVLISDGFPQDLDYGDDRQSHTYGIRDTATAMRETQAAGVKPFCITVDLAGHDYLREMCDPDAYVIIERVADLPRELPRIYQRLVRAA